MASIVVVDDEPKTRNALEFILRQAGHAVCTAASGYEALAHLRTGEMDLLLSDVKMPHMDGLTFRSTQLALPAVANIPVIVISAVGTGRGAASLAFARTFTKPINTDQLLVSIREVLAPPES